MSGVFAVIAVASLYGLKMAWQSVADSKSEIDDLLGAVTIGLTLVTTIISAVAFAVTWGR